MRKVIFLAIFLLIATPIFANDFKFGDRVVLEVDKPITISNVSVLYKGVVNEKGCPHKMSLFDISINDEKITHKHYHGCGIGPSRFKINNVEYALEVGISSVLPYPTPKFAEGEIILWLSDDWGKKYAAHTKKYFPMLSN